jgi:two-component system, response regulator, stage 0 sporulation protein F
MKKARLLIVDDEENIRFLFKEELEEEGYEIEVASNGLEALDKVKNAAFDLVILDIKMPGMNGIQALNEIKNINKNLPVILCSAYGEFKQDFSSWASDGYVVKSADTKELKQTIKDLLGIA